MSTIEPLLQTEREVQGNEAELTRQTNLPSSERILLIASVGQALLLLLTGLSSLIFTVSEQLKDVHLQFACGRAVAGTVDIVFCQRDGQALPPAALHWIIEDCS